MAKTPVLAPTVTTDWKAFPAPGEVVPVEVVEEVEEVVVEESVSE